MAELSVFAGHWEGLEMGLSPMAAPWLLLGLVHLELQVQESQATESMA